MYKKSRYYKTINIIYLFKHCKYIIFSVTLHYLNEPLRCFYLAAGRCESLLLPFLLQVILRENPSALAMG